MRVLLVFSLIAIHNLSYALDSLKVLDYDKRIQVFISEIKKIKNKTISYDEIREDLKSKKLKDKIKLSGNIKNEPYQNLQDFYNQYKKSVLMLGIYYEDNNGSNSCSFNSAFVISDEGICVTTYNSIDNIHETSRSLAVMDYEYNVYPIKEILHADRKSNIVLFKIKTKKTLYPLSLQKKYNVAEHIQIISHPRNIFYSLSDGIIAQKIYMNQNLVMISAPFSDGSYGAPVLNDKGQVVAVCAHNKPIYYTENTNSPFQMFVNICSPVENILKLTEK